ncbi:MAG: hypothetical protein FJX37_05770 [Alphaproteobacteria bacterium]|nr:hypothetical protein [Alphaproteobacteria bacterium]MBM3732221.1 hypothetical protein [Acidimicrobiia bacterium]MBM3950283.1 hypothetical protein [Rhodospirillales bacterium]
MLTIEDCVALSGLTEAEILAIAEHEHIPFTAAAEMGRCLFCAEHGLDTLRLMILEDIWAAKKRGDRAHVRELKQALKDYAATRREKTDAAPYA